MRGGKSMADRGVIPRLLSSVYRRARKIEKDSDGATEVGVSMSYYEIYNDKVFDLFEPHERRTMAGLPIRENEKAKAVVVGLTERPCATLKEFEQLYDQANVNRSTSATKLNAHSSRSHAILSVKVSQTTGSGTRISTVSAIDLAGSEDNRRTDNNKERLVESAAINKSLFVLAQCVEAISKKQVRVPYRESKMTRILALGQNNAHTIMVLNLSPVRSYHLDTLSSLNFANRTKNIEVNEIENLPIFRQVSSKKLEGHMKSAGPVPIPQHRQPLRPKILSHDSHIEAGAMTNGPKPTKTFSVFSDKPSASETRPNPVSKSDGRHIKSQKRISDEIWSATSKPMKAIRPNGNTKLENHGMSASAIEALIDRKVNEALAERADNTTVSQSDGVSDEVQKRLDALEKRVEGQETERTEGLQYLLMAKQHQVRGEHSSALKMYQLALPYFPGNERLAKKLAVLKERMAVKKARMHASPRLERTVSSTHAIQAQHPPNEPSSTKSKGRAIELDESYYEDQDEHAWEDEDENVPRPRTRIRAPVTLRTIPGSIPAKPAAPEALSSLSREDTRAYALTQETPRTKQLLRIVNTRDIGQIRLLRGVGKKRGEAIVNALGDVEDEVANLGQLARLRGVGGKTVENMREGL